MLQRIKQISRSQESNRTIDNTLQFVPNVLFADPDTSGLPAGDDSERDTRYGHKE